MSLPPASTFKRFAPWLALAGLALLVAWTPLPGRLGPPAERTIRLHAVSFEYTPPVIHVNQGDRVNLEIVSTDVVHGVYIDGYGLQAIAEPGQTARLSFVANQPGSFRFRCPVACGALHPFMIGQLKVGSNGLLYRGIGLAFLAVLAAWLFSRQPLGGKVNHP
jgi:heme/copper-type cytochrome/quinol oxidase subunit 2